MLKNIYMNILYLYSFKLQQVFAEFSKFKYILNVNKNKTDLKNKLLYDKTFVYSVKSFL